MAEKLKEPSNGLLRFVLDGVYYALQQNVYPPEGRVKLESQLQDWFPGIHFVVTPKEIKYFETGQLDDDGA